MRAYSQTFLSHGHQPAGVDFSLLSFLSCEMRDRLFVRNINLQTLKRGPSNLEGDLLE